MSCDMRHVEVALIIIRCVYFVVIVVFVVVQVFLFSPRRHNGTLRCYTLDSIVVNKSFGSGYAGLGEMRVSLI